MDILFECRMCLSIVNVIVRIWCYGIIIVPVRWSKINRRLNQDMTTFEQTSCSNQGLPYMTFHHQEALVIEVNQSTVAL